LNEREQRQFINDRLRDYLAKYLKDYNLLRQDGTRPLTGNLDLDDHNLANVGEIHLTPKASSTGAEGTIYYDSDDDSVYVATE
jgi:hypothetical protein